MSTQNNEFLTMADPLEETKHRKTDDTAPMDAEEQTEVQTNTNPSNSLKPPPPPPPQQPGRPPPQPPPPRPRRYVDCFVKKGSDANAVVHDNKGRTFKPERNFKTYLDFSIPNSRAPEDAVAALKPLVLAIKAELPDVVFYPAKIAHASAPSFVPTAELPATATQLEKLFDLKFFPTNRKDGGRTGLFYVGTNTEVDRFIVARIRTVGMNPKRWSISLRGVQEESVDARTVFLFSPPKYDADELEKVLAQHPGLAAYKVSICSRPAPVWFLEQDDFPTEFSPEKRSQLCEEIKNLGSGFTMITVQSESQHAKAVYYALKDIYKLKPDKHPTQTYPLGMTMFPIRVPEVKDSMPDARLDYAKIILLQKQFAATLFHKVVPFESESLHIPLPTHQFEGKGPDLTPHQILITTPSPGKKFQDNPTINNRLFLGVSHIRDFKTDELVTDYIRIYYPNSLKLEGARAASALGFLLSDAIYHEHNNTEWLEWQFKSVDQRVPGYNSLRTSYKWDPFEYCLSPLETGYEQELLRLFFDTDAMEATGDAPDTVRVLPEAGSTHNSVEDLFRLPYKFRSSGSVVSSMTSGSSRISKAVLAAQLEETRKIVTVPTQEERDESRQQVSQLFSQVKLVMPRLDMDRPAPLKTLQNMSADPQDSILDNPPQDNMLDDSNITASSDFPQELATSSPPTCQFSFPYTQSSLRAALTQDVQGEPSKPKALGWQWQQLRLYDTIGSKLSLKRWTTALIQKIWDTAWDQWEHRNEALHRGA